MVPRAGLEPALCCQKRILNPSRLPIPPPGRPNGKKLLPDAQALVNHLDQRKEAL